MSVEPSGEHKGWIGLRRLPKESDLRAVLITLIVCLVCSASIAATVAVLRPYQEANRAAERQAKIGELIASIPGLDDVLGSVGENQIEFRVVDLESGREVDDLDPAEFDARQAARDPDRSVAIPRDLDLAGLGRRARLARVYLIKADERLRLLVLPVEGSGYISTLRGYLALDGDLRTIRGLSFYEHSETPGLGSEIDNPDWRALWPGKLAFDEAGRIRISVVRGRVDTKSATQHYEVDGISGATRTSEGVSNLLHFWLGPQGFGPYLDHMAASSGTETRGGLE